MRNVHFLFSETQLNFCNKLFDLVEVSTTQSRTCGAGFSHPVKVQPNFCNQNYKTQCKFRIFAILGGKGASNFLKKVGIDNTAVEMKQNLVQSIKLRFKPKKNLKT